MKIFLFRNLLFIRGAQIVVKSTMIDHYELLSLSGKSLSQLLHLLFVHWLFQVIHYLSNYNV